MSIYPEVVPGPPRPSVIRQIGAMALPPGCERYAVPGAGAILLTLRAGDRLEILNLEGAQAGEIVPIDMEGRCDPGLLGVSGDGTGAGLQALLASGNDSLARLQKGMARRGVDLSALRSIGVFGGASPAGDRAEFTAGQDGSVVIAAPGAPMDFERQDTLTSLTVYIYRAKVQAGQRHPLPEPLADPLQDIRVGSSTAESYLVRAGEYIQIIDVDGRQCTDFQCFDARKLDRGIVHPLDVTTTRTVQHRDYPMPGLHAKYYDHEMLPLVEVIQDTCGRHDAFALACAPKYYDDMGYPGHINCTDNFNGALAKHGVPARPGWMAANFFFNTGIDDHGVLYADEPWSRPGDYVLMRALTDIVCVSSACPDDTSAANGWNPSDIHVRSYSGEERFQRASAWRPTPESDPQMTKQTGFHESFAKHTRNFVEYNGYWLANCYADAGPIEEYWACREKAVILDLSPLRKFEVTGPDAEALLQYCMTRNIRKLAVGQVVYTAMCYPHGGMIDDGTVFRLGKDNFRWIGGCDYGGEWLREKAQELGLNVLVRSSTDQQHNVAVQGPESRDILKQIIWTPPHQPGLTEIDWFRFTVGRIGGEHGVPVVVSRTGYTGELGYEVFCHPKDAGVVFDAIWDAGKPHGLRPMGLEALDMVRIEAGLIFAGYDFCEQTDPFEAGIGFTVPLKSKEEDFIGREALIRRKTTPARKLVGLVIDSAVDVAHGDPVHLGRAQIGEVTSSMRSPLLRKNIALARVDVTCAEIGTALEVGKLDGQQKRLPAEVTGFAHYDPGKTRPRS
ncbi:MAG: aminomethyltransferase family protein [Mangrovicoccus sp.]|nr:aminomethyltransferase family protein [Mangrovicoccus sp.]